VTRFYLSANSSYNDGDILIGGRTIEALAAGASSSGSTTVTIPEGTSTGNWYILARADGEGAVVESSETNNTYARIVKIGPDLVVTALTVPAVGGAGQTIAITDTTKNVQGGAAGPSRTQFYLSTDTALGASDALIGGRAIEGLAAGAGSSGTTTVTIPEGTAVGSWYIVAKADGEGAVVELSETNNTFPKPIKIGPDLDITALSAPATAGAGQAIAVTDTTTNQGGAAADPSRTQFYLSADTTIGASDILIGERTIEGLAAGAGSSGSTTVTIPQGTSTGNWHILAVADGEGVVSETTESNNTSSKSIRIGPDLAVTAMSAPSTAAAGQAIAVTDTTKNQGGGSADPSRTQFFLSADTALGEPDVLLASRDVPSLAAGASSPGSTTVTIPEGTAAGNWYLIAKADGEGVVAETAETNNTSTRAIKIGPDLAVTTMSAPSTGGAGQTIAITDTTKNQGGGAADPSRTQFFLSTDASLGVSDILLGSRNIPSLAAGATSSGPTSVAIPPGTAAGSWYIIAKADGEGVVAETSESNNTYSKYIKIGPDLDITALTAPASAAAGQSIVITDTTKNQGGGAADPSQTHFYLSADTTLDASDILLGSRSIPLLAGGASNAGSTTVTVPLGTATGSWYIIAKADGEGVVNETSEANNTFTLSFKII
jgi:subtilase family serine protease